jgi:signal peptidase II
VREVEAPSTPSSGTGPAAPGAATSDAGRAGRGASGRPRWAEFFGLAAAVVVADQLTKAWLTSFLAPGESVDVVGNLIRLVHGENAGGLFGVFQGQALPFALISLVVVGLIVLFHARSGRNPYLSVTLGLLLGGAVGNLTDRIRLGYVVDFVDAGLGTARWYTFNVADAAISVAILLLLAASIWPSVARRGAGGGS